MTTFSTTWMSALIGFLWLLWTWRAERRREE
jgi:hypothetical protein